MHSLGGAVAAALFITLTATACGSGDSSSAYEDARARKSAEAERESAAAEARLDRLRELRDRCARQTAPLFEALAQIDSRLSVGMDYGEYGDRLGDVQVAYDRLPIRQMDRACVAKVGIPLERAFNSYNKAAGVWDRCIDDYYCDFDSGPEIATARRHWSDAEGNIRRAKVQLRGLARP